MWRQPLECGSSGYRWRIGTVQGAVATWRFVGDDFRGYQVATAPCTVPFSEFASGIARYRFGSHLQCYRLPGKETRVGFLSIVA
jgi:hypothetical protein